MTVHKVDRDQCFFPCRHSIDWKLLAKVLDKHFGVKKRRAGGLTLTGMTPDAPAPFVVTQFALGDIPAATGLRGPRATRWKQELTGLYTSCVSLHVKDLAAVLDETNCLILAQGTIQHYTRGPIVLAWNREVVPPL